MLPSWYSEHHSQLWLEGGGGGRGVETRLGLSAFIVSTLSPGYSHIQPAIYSLIIHLPYLPSQPAFHSGGQTVPEA